MTAAMAAGRARDSRVLVPAKGSKRRMADQVFLAVDLGASSGRVLAGLFGGRRLQLEEVHRFENGAVDFGGSLQWNILGLWSHVLTGLRAARSKYADRIRSVGVDTWG